MHMFYVINLGLNHMLLGMPFLAATNPNIDWTKGMFRGKVIASSMDAYKWIPNQDSRVYNLFRAIKTYYHFEWPEEGELYMLNITLEDYDSQIDPTTSTFIWQITKSTELAAQSIDKTECPWQILIPAKYHQFGKVFSKEELHQFPKSRQWDHAIDLVQDIPKTLDCKMYPLAKGQQRNLDKFLDKHLEKGYIYVSNSPYASPFFFIKKKNGELQPVQDYRKLNKYTIWNTYPLPLIKELIRNLVKKTWFTKFDIHWGYNNICIKKGDEWKATFKTNRGLFEPTVMFFGLTNSLATFQTMMNVLFHNEIVSEDIIIYMDDILITTIGSLNDH